jgi:hypothetical protein
MNDQLADASALGAAIIAFALDRSKAFYFEGHAQERFVREFLVMCEMGIGVIATGHSDPGAKALWGEIEEEFLRFNPQHLDLLEERQESYFDVLANGAGPRLWPEARHRHGWLHRK